MVFSFLFFFFHFLRWDAQHRCDSVILRRHNTGTHLNGESLRPFSDCRTWITRIYICSRSCRIRFLVLRNNGENQKNNRKIKIEKKKQNRRVRARVEVKSEKGNERSRIYFVCVYYYYTVVCPRSPSPRPSNHHHRTSPRARLYATKLTAGSPLKERYLSRRHRRRRRRRFSGAHTYTCQVKLEFAKFSPSNRFQCG